MIINLTPHVLNIIIAEGEVRNVDPSGEIARVATSKVDCDAVDGIPVVKTGFGAVEGLPPQQSGVWLVVSRLVLSAATERTDLLAPGELVRDTAGKPIGCKGLSR